MIPTHFSKLLTILLCTGIHVLSQKTLSTHKEIIKVVSDVKTFRKQVSDDPHKRMTDLINFIPGLKTDLKYATNRNFTKVRLYPLIKTTYLREPAAKALALVQEDLNSRGLAVKIFDAYRPYSVTLKMWDLIKDERYVADPKKGSGHNRGLAIDLTIVDLATGKELNMGTGFDNFSDTAHHDFTNLPAEVINNRTLLKTVMEKHGFKALATEWWHYSFITEKEFELLDINFKTLDSLNKRSF